jgi:hypothetical protein
MTCIIALEHEGHVWMGGDSSAIDDSRDVFLIASPKVFTVKNAVDTMVMGCSGGFRAMQALKYSLVVPERLSTETDEQWACTKLVDAIRSTILSSGKMANREGTEQISDGFAIVFGYLGKAYIVEPDFGVVRSTRGFEAIGCGAKYALGSLRETGDLDPYNRILHALAAAEYFNASVRAPFTVITQGKG